MSKYKFIEKQYFGLNKISLSTRLLCAVFCFIMYYFRENQQKTGDAYFFIGISMIIISILLFFVLHFRTEIDRNSIILDGLWTTRKVKINIDNLVQVKIVSYSKFIFNRTVYNLHFQGKIRFYTRGEYALELVDKDGLIYLIGSQKAEELHRVLNEKINKK
jgi:hypothetical protein|tara:strand:+ start:9106 stop:9588 length:483 start_codon:yes stop_codon:yes gene_type:complete